METALSFSAINSMAGLSSSPSSYSRRSSSSFNIEDEIGDYPSPRAGNEDGPSDAEKGQRRRTTPSRPPLVTGPSSGRVSRIQSITRKSSWAAGFTHALSHVKSSKEFIVDFEGPDDPYHPRNWPFRKKVVTTLLYSFTTAGITLASSMSVDTEVLGETRSHD